jgi:hypothetical protein
LFFYYYELYHSNDLLGGKELIYYASVIGLGERDRKKRERGRERESE